MSFQTLTQSRTTPLPSGATFKPVNYQVLLETFLQYNVEAPDRAVEGMDVGEAEETRRPEMT